MPLPGIPFIQFGSREPGLVFSPGNGYPAACYTPLLARLGERWGVLSPEPRPLWPGEEPSKLQDWGVLTQDMARFLDERAVGPLVGVGHSLGGAIMLRLALQQPQRFKALALLDPVLFLPGVIWAWRLMYYTGLVKRHPLVQAARRRRTSFASLQAAYDAYRPKRLFRYMSDAGLKAMLGGMFCEETPGGPCHLVYPRAWEERIYVTGLRKDMALWRALPGLALPLLVVRGAETDTFRVETGERMQQLTSRIKVVTLERTTHLAPLERPEQTAELIENFLKEYL